MRNGPGIDHQHDQRREDIESRHQRHQPSGNLGNPLDTAKKHRANEQCYDDTRIEMWDAEVGVQRVGDGIGLHHVADAETGNAGKQREGDGEPAPVRPHAVLDVIHRPADKIAILVSLAEPHGTDGFGIFGRHADKSRHPHPEDGTRAAEEDGRRHTGDVAGADGRRQRGHQGVEGGDVTGVITGDATLTQQGKAERDLHYRQEPQANRQEQPGAEDQDQHGNAPYDSVHGTDKFGDCFHLSFLSSDASSCIPERNWERYRGQGERPGSHRRVRIRSLAATCDKLS